MPVPTPTLEESQEEFMKRCITFIVDEGTPQEQAVAICTKQWEQKTGERKLEYHASVLSFKAAEEGIETVIYLMNTSKNRNGWGVTDKALIEALPTLIGKPIGLGEGYQLGHHADVQDVGTFTEVDKPNGYAVAKALITDPVAVEAIQTKQWGPVSVVILSYDESCSNCGETLTGYENPFTHECIANGKGYLQIESFKFERVDFVEDPAYPQAGTISFATETLPVEQPALLLAASYYEGNSQSNKDTPQGAVNPEGKEEKLTDEIVAELKAEIEQLKADLKQTTDSLVEERELREAQLEAQRAELIEEVKEARVRAGLPESDLTLFTAEQLKTMKADAEAIAEKISQIKSRSKPMTTYTPGDEGDELQAAVTRKREELLGRTEPMYKEAHR